MAGRNDYFKSELSDEAIELKEHGDKGDTFLGVVCPNSSSEDKNSPGDVAPKKDGTDLLYAVDENPPWYLCILLGFQHYLTAFGSTLTVPLVLAGPLCIGQDMVGLSELITTFFFVSGIVTVLQTTLGMRLPIIQGATFAFLAPTVGILSLPEWQCPQNVSGPLVPLNTTHNASVTLDIKEVWQSRIREVQGAICVAALFQVFIGASGLLNVVLRYVGPLTIAPTITLIGLSLFEVAANKASTHWGISVMTIVLIALFSQYLNRIRIPIPTCRKNKAFTWLPLFKLFPILLAIIVSWVMCVILTSAGVFPDDPTSTGYLARTDTKTDVVRDTSWFRVPYPGQWGLPTVSAGAVFGMLAGVLASMIESIGDYYACARLSGAAPPPTSAINRGITIEGIGCIIAGLIGTGNGTTSYSENVGAIGITRVGSLRVIQCAGVLLILFGCIGKLGAVFVTIPDPVVGGLFLSMFGMITAVGLSNLQYVNMNSSRNLFVIASSLFLGLSIPHWIARSSGVISTGVANLDQIIQVLLSTSMFVGGVIGFLLDATLPGTPEERGLAQWTTASSFKVSADRSQRSNYDVPLCGKFLRSRSWIRYVPICPSRDASTLEKTSEKYIL